MLDMVVDRRELKDVITRVLRFGGRPAPVPAPAALVQPVAGS
jgi:hypothetical protein